MIAGLTPGLLLAGLLLLVPASGTTHAPEIVERLAPPAAGDTTVITVSTFGANLDFEPARFSAPQGTVVKVVYVNESVLPHNLVVVKDPDDVAMLGQAAYTADETGFVPMEHEDRMIAFTDLASPGETVEVVFTMPEAGEYTFVCLVPGHYNMMLGVMRSTE
jgi:uncharacterized cupredoxin-like copper-binding protein